MWGLRHEIDNGTHFAKETNRDLNTKLLNIDYCLSRLLYFKKTTQIQNKKKIDFLRSLFYTTTRILRDTLNMFRDTYSKNHNCVERNKTSL